MLLGPKARAFRSIALDENGNAKRIISFGDLDDAYSPALSRHLQNELRDNQLIATTPVVPDSPLHTCIPLPSHYLFDGRPTHSSSFTLKDLSLFFASCAAAKWRLRFMRIEEVTRAIAHRRRLAPSRDRLDLSETQRLVRLYNTLRPLLPGNYLCLFDSLSLIEYLANYDIFPYWVFAVRSDPWMAHCWVQLDTVSFNQDVDDARTYLPIMAV